MKSSKRKTRMCGLEEEHTGKIQDSRHEPYDKVSPKSPKSIQFQHTRNKSMCYFWRLRATFKTLYGNRRGLGRDFDYESELEFETLSFV